jgi:hypothetical protein
VFTLAEQFCLIVVLHIRRKGDDGYKEVTSEIAYIRFYVPFFVSRIWIAIPCGESIMKTKLRKDSVLLKLFANPSSYSCCIVEYDDVGNPAKVGEDIHESLNDALYILS